MVMVICMNGLAFALYWIIDWNLVACVVCKLGCFGCSITIKQCWYNSEFDYIKLLSYSACLEWSGDMTEVIRE